MHATEIQIQIIRNSVCYANQRPALNESVLSNQTVAVSLLKLCVGIVSVCRWRTQRPYQVDVSDLFSLWLRSKITSFSLEAAVQPVKEFWLNRLLMATLSVDPLEYDCTGCVTHDDVELDAKHNQCTVSGSIAAF